MQTKPLLYGSHHADAVEAVMLGKQPGGDRRGIHATNSNNVTVTRLPYMGERRGLKFDNRRGRFLRSRRPLSRDLRDGDLAFQDFQRGMHMMHRCTASEMRLMYTPAFAANDEQARLVLAQQCYSYACSILRGLMHGRVPDDLVNDREKLEALMKRAVEAQRRAYNASQEHETQ